MEKVKRLMMRYSEITGGVSSWIREAKIIGYNKSERMYSVKFDGFVYTECVFTDDIGEVHKEEDGDYYVDLPDIYDNLNEFEDKIILEMIMDAKSRIKMETKRVNALGLYYNKREGR